MTYTKINYFKNRPDYLFCISDPSGNYYDKYKNQLISNVIFITESHSFYKVIKLVDVVLRYTATDGDALSVKEGLYLRKKVIATDCVDRAGGGILCHYNDEDSLTIALTTETQYNIELSEDDVTDGLIEIYNSLNNN